MSATRKKMISLIYNGVEAYQDLEPYVDQITYTDAVDQSDTISFSLSDRDIKWREAWIPAKGDMLIPAITLENWNYETEKMTIQCGAFVVDDFEFSSPPDKGSINGVSSPVETSFKETENTKTWEAATVQLIAAEIAGKYGLTLVYEAGDIPIAKTEQDKKTDSDFLRSVCEKYGLGMKVYHNRLVIWDYPAYFAKTPVLTITPDMCSKWSYRSTMQGTYTGARVSYKNPNTKKLIDIIVGTEERLYRSNQRADNEAEARRIGEAAVRNANRKGTIMRLLLPPKFSLMAAATVQIVGFGRIDGIYFIEKVVHQISRKSYEMQVNLSRILQEKKEEEQEVTALFQGTSYVVQKGDNLWDLSQKFYGTPARCTDLYRANQATIEAEAQKHGKVSSSGGYWIWQGTQLQIPT